MGLHRKGEGFSNKDFFFAAEFIQRRFLSRSCCYSTDFDSSIRGTYCNCLGTLEGFYGSLGFKEMQEGSSQAISFFDQFLQLPLIFHRLHKSKNHSFH